MKLLLFSLYFLNTSAKRFNREDGDDADADIEATATAVPDVLATSTVENLLDMEEDDDDEYDIEDYYEDYPEEGSGGLLDTFIGMGKSILNPVRNMFGGSDEDEFDQFEGSAVVDEWWKTWSENYDDDLYEETDVAAGEQVTRYPLPNLNENGHIDMSEFGFRDTLDEYFDIFVIILSASILLLLACAAYGRIRNIRYLKNKYGDKLGADEKGGAESGALLAKSSE